MRAQGNFAEYAPFGLFLLALVELFDAPNIAVHLLGLMLLSGRLLHAWGFSASPPVMNGRVLGMILTLTMILFSALGLCYTVCFRAIVIFLEKSSDRVIFPLAGIRSQA